MIRYFVKVMKKILSILSVFVLSLFTFLCNAQDAEMMQKAQEKFKNMQTLEADVTVTKHNTMVTKDVVTKGKFYFKKPSKMCLNAGTDILLMDGQTFTMVKDGKKQSFNGSGNNQFEALKTMMQNFSASQESDIDLSEIADIDMEQSGNLIKITIAPIVTDPKEKRKMMFTSFVVTIDQQKAELKSIRLNEKGQNYTQYDFSGFKQNGTIADSVFEAK